MTHQLAEMRELMADLADTTRQRSLLQADLEALTAEEAALLARASADLNTKRETLRELEVELLSVQAEEAQVASALEAASSLNSYRHQLSAQLDLMLKLTLPNNVQETVRADLSASKDLTAALQSHSRAVVDVLWGSEEARTHRELELRALAEPIRSELNEAERGLGELTARARNIRAQLTKLDATQQRLHDLRVRYAGLAEARGELLDALEANSETRYQARVGIADTVSRNLGSRVTVSVEHLADSGVFRDFLLTSLQGSGLKYAAIAEAFSSSTLASPIA